MNWKLFDRNTALTAMVLFALASPTIATAVDREAPATQEHTCPNSTKSITQLAMIDKIGDRDFQCLGVSLDANTVMAIRLETHRFVSSDQPNYRESVKIEEFVRAVVESSRGAVLDGVPGHDAVVLRGHFATPSGKVELVASYLYNGITGVYHSCLITLDQAPDTGWHLVNRLNKTVSHIVIRTRQIPLIGDFGIAELDGACN